MASELEGKFEHAKLVLSNLIYDLDKRNSRRLVTDDETESLNEPWNALIRFAGKLADKSDDEIDEFADGLGSYYDMDNVRHWPETMLAILQWLEGIE